MAIKYVLYLAATGSQIWINGDKGWQEHVGPLVGPVWVLTDLAEESFIEIQIPRIFGPDRQRFVARQLASRFPETPYRMALPAGATSSLIDRIAPLRLTVLGLDAAERVNDALDALTAPATGLWTTSMLMATIGGKKSLPPDLFVILPKTDALRIVFIKSRVPILSRLIPGITQIQDQAAEIALTLRHLENTRVLDRSDARYAVLVLGNSQGMAAWLEPEHLDLIEPPPPWNFKVPKDWFFALLDLAITSPVGQLAPLKRREEFSASRLRPPAYTAAAICLGLALWVAADNLSNAMASYSSKSRAQANISKLATQMADTEKKILDLGVSSQLMGSALAVDQVELNLAPSLADHMQQIGKVIDMQEEVRLKRFAWSIVAPGQLGCNGGAKPPMEDPAKAGAASASRDAEISFEIMLPEDLQQNSRTQAIAKLSDQLTKIDGIHVLSAPAKEVAPVVLSSGKAPAIVKSTLSWCLSLPGKEASAIKAPTIAKP
jgi:hypothetical protein